MPWIVSKYWSALRRNATAEDSGREESFSATSFITLASATAGHAPALEQWHEQDAGRREVEHVLRAAVRRPPHLDDLQGPQKVAAALEVPRHHDAVRQGLFDAPPGVAFLLRPGLGHEERGAALRAQDRAEPQEELPDPFLILDSITYGRHGIQDEPTDLLVLDHAGDGVDECTRRLGVHVLAVDAEVLVHLREVDELQAALLHQALVEEVERDDVLQQLVRGLGDAQVQGVLVREGAADQEFDADRGLPRAHGAGDEHGAAARDAAVQDVIDRVDSCDASLPLAGVALLRGHRLTRPSRGALYEVNALSIRWASSRAGMRRADRPAIGLRGILTHVRP